MQEVLVIPRYVCNVLTLEYNTTNIRLIERVKTREARVKVENGLVEPLFMLPVKCKQ